MDEQFRERLRSAVDAILQGAPVREYQTELTHVAAAAVASERVGKAKRFLDRCHALFAEVSAIDLTDQARVLSSEELFGAIEQATTQKIYFEPVVEAAPVPALLPGATISDNRLIFVFSLLVAYPDSFWDRLEYFFKWVVWGRACMKEFQNRLGILKPYVMDFIWFTLSERGWREEDQETLRDAVRPTDWRTLAIGIGLNQGDREEIDAMIDFQLANQRAVEAKRSITEIAFRALEGKFDFLPHRIRSRLMDARRNQHAKKRKPPGGSTAEFNDETPDTAQTSGSYLAEALEAKLRASERTLVKAYGPRALDVLLAYVVAGKSADQKTIGKLLGISDRQVRTYLKKFDRHPEALRGALEP